MNLLNTDLAVFTESAIFLSSFVLRSVVTFVKLLVKYKEGWVKLSIIDRFLIVLSKTTKSELFRHKGLAKKWQSNQKRYGLRFTLLSNL